MAPPLLPDPGLPAVVRRPVRAGIRAWLQLEVSGAEHVPATGGVLLAASHLSHADGPAVAAAVARPVRLLGTADLMARWPASVVLPRLGLVPIVRGDADTATLALVAGLLADGAAVVVFPEGTRSRDGRVHRPRSGVARLAALAGVPVVPVGLHGTDGAWPVAPTQGRGGPRRPPAPVRVAIGSPLEAPGTTPRDRRAFADLLHDRLVALSGRPRAEGFAPAGGEGAPAHEAAA